MDESNDENDRLIKSNHCIVGENGEDQGDLADMVKVLKNEKVVAQREITRLQEALLMSMKEKKTLHSDIHRLAKEYKLKDDQTMTVLNDQYEDVNDAIFESAESEIEPSNAFITQEAVIRGLRVEIEILLERLKEAQDSAQLSSQNSSTKQDRIAHSASAVANQESIITALKFEINILQDRLSAANNDMTIFSTESDAQKIQHKLSTNAILNQEAIIAGLNMELDILQERLQEVQKDAHDTIELTLEKQETFLQSTRAVATQESIIAGLNYEVTILEERLADEDNEVSQLRQVCEEYQCKISDMEQSALIHLEEIELLVKQKEEISTNLKNLQENLKVTESERNEALAEIIHLKQNMSKDAPDSLQSYELKSTVEQSMSAVLTQESVITGLNFELKIMEDRLIETENEIGKLHKELFENKSRISDLEEGASMHSHEVEFLVKQKEDMNQKLSSMEIRLEELKNEKEISSGEIKRLEDTLEKALADKVEVEDDLKRCLERFRLKELDLLDTIDNMRSRMSDLETTLEKMSEQSPSNAASEVLLDFFRRSIEQFRTKEIELQNVITNLKSENENLIGRNDSTKSDSGRNSNSSSRNVERILFLENRLKEYQLQIERMRAGDDIYLKIPFDINIDATSDIDAKSPDDARMQFATTWRDV